jgi:hypothetical protein
MKCRAGWETHATAPKVVVILGGWILFAVGDDIGCTFVFNVNDVFGPARERVVVSLVS